MSKKPKLDKIEERLKQNKNFEITRDNYVSLTGTDTPQNKNYTEKRSAVSKIAAKYGYSVRVKTEILVFEKTA